MTHSAGTFLALAAMALAGAAAAQETPRQYCERQQGIVRDVCLRDLERSARPSAPAASVPSAATERPAPSAAASASGGATPYKVSGGTQVDDFTYKGFQTWRQAACDRCHGPNQEGLVGPSLINSLKTLSKDDFKKTVTNGRLEKGMPSFSTSQQVMGNLDSLYAYLKGRSDGAITQAHVQRMP